MISKSRSLVHLITTMLTPIPARKQGIKLLYRTGAAFVSARLGISPIPPLSASQLAPFFKPHVGGLIIAGSYVPKTTAQLSYLTSHSGDGLTVVVIKVESLLAGEDVLASALQVAEAEIQQGKDVLVMTSRDLITGSDERESLDIGSKVAVCLVQFLQKLTIRPRYIIAKGGITSSDMATKGLGMKKAMVVGQALKGVPLWRCEEDGVKWKGLPFVVFPGNVGGEEALFELVESWRKDG